MKGKNGLRYNVLILSMMGLYDFEKNIKSAGIDTKWRMSNLTST